MATTSSIVERQSWPLGESQPFMLLTCDGCGHCGEGADPEKLKGIEKQELEYLRIWTAQRSMEMSPESLIMV